MKALFCALIAFASWNAKANGERCWNDGVHPEKMLVKDVSYQTGPDAQRLSIYKPANRKPPYRTVMLIHGGCFAWGDRKSQDNMNEIRRLLSAGYAVVSVDYRKVSDKDKKARYPASWEDVQDAVRYVREHAAENGLDTKRLCSMGYSAGATLSLYLCNRPIKGSGRRIDTKSQTDPTLSAPLDCVIDFFGRTDFTAGAVRPEPPEGATDPPPQRDCAERYLEESRTVDDMADFRHASILPDVKMSSCDVLAVHGLADADVSSNNSKDLCDKYKAVIERTYKSDPAFAKKLLQKKCEFVPIPGGLHMFLKPGGEKTNWTHMNQAWKSVCKFLSRENYLPSPSTLKTQEMSFKQDPEAQP